MSDIKKYHKHPVHVLPIMPDTIVSVVKNEKTKQRGEAIGIKGATSFEELDKKAYERMKRDKKKR